MQSNAAGVVLMTYGSATTAKHVSEYMNHIYKGTAPESLVVDFEHRYSLVGGSPLIKITEKLAELLQKKLGGGYIVQSGMRHSEPFIEKAVASCRLRGATRLIGIILSPQFSSFIMEGYRADFLAAAKKHGFSESDVTIAPPWPAESHFTTLLARRVEESLSKLSRRRKTDISVVFTTHSLPQRVVEKDPTYLRQLSQTIKAVRKKLALPSLKWHAAYQSAGHTPEVWLKPDLVDILAKLRDKKTPAILIVPIQFLTDHLEILYDLDIAAKEQCKEYGIAYNRIKLPNTDPLFVAALVAIVKNMHQGIRARYPLNHPQTPR